MTVTISVLGSGSRGNCTFIRTDEVRLLIDAGMGRREVSRRLESIGEDPDGVDAVLVTHEHTDHAGALRTLVKDFSLKAYLSCGTMAALKTDEYELNGSEIIPITPDIPFTVGDVEVRAFRVPHDAAEPVAFTINVTGLKITQLTDVGWLSEPVADHLRGSDVLILESNHDIEMLRAGPYPWNLKQRLMSRHGHLSNTAVAQFIREQYDGRARHLVLAHLSSTNNHPEIVKQEALRAIRFRGLNPDLLYVTNQDIPSPPIWL